MRDLSAFNLLGASAPFLRALELVHRFAASSATVLVQGETGTGKELAARAIHYLSERRHLPFVPVNCGALPESLVESELFGHARGAFTDAREARPGLVHQTRNGTLFLDEIEAMPARAQVVLLRFLQDKEFRPVGGSAVETSGVRIVGATNADLGALVKQGTFRADLLFRLNVLRVELPPLRQRSGDVTLLARAFIERLNKQTGGPPMRLSAHSTRVLEAYAWPGNVRELENFLQRQYVLGDPGGELAVAPHDLGLDDDGGACARAPECAEAFKIAKARAVAQFEKAYIEALLLQTAGNITQASRLSGKDRSDIGKLVRKHGIGSRR